MRQFKSVILAIILLLSSLFIKAQKKINQPEQDFKLADVNGTLVSLSSFKGKVVLLDFWASWCGPCRARNPSQVKLYDELKDKGFVILGVSLDEDLSAWKRAIAKDKITYPQLNDPFSWESKTAQLYNVNQIPTTLLIDKNGIVQYADLEGKELKTKITELLVSQ